MYELIVDFINTPAFMYMMVVWAIMLPAFLYAFHYHSEIASLNGIVGELIKVIYLLVSSYEIIGLCYLYFMILSALK